MKPITLEWIEKAEDDWDVAQCLYRKRKRPSYDAVCYHAQQSIEKYLKGRLEEVGSRSICLPESRLGNSVFPVAQPVHGWGKGEA